MFRSFTLLILLSFCFSIMFVSSVASPKTIEDILALPEEEINLAEASLYIARELWQDVFGASFDVVPYLKQLNEMALALKKRIDEVKDPQTVITVMIGYLSEELGFEVTGEPEGAFLNFVLEERRGNCIGLSTLYLSLGERLKLPLYAVAVPGHLFVRYDDGQREIDIAFAEAGLLNAICSTRTSQTLQSNPFYLKNLTKRETIGVLLSERGTVYKEHGFYDKAIADYTRAIEINPGDADAYFGRGQVYYEQGHYDRAVVDYTKSIELNPEDADAYYNRGLAYAHQQIYDKAIADFTRAIELNPKDAEAYSNRGAVYFSQGLLDESIADLTKAIELNPEDAKAYFNRGNAYCQQGAYDKGIADYVKAIELNPEFAVAYFNLALTYDIVNRPEEALRSYEKFVRLAAPGYEKYVAYALERAKYIKKKLSQVNR